MYQKKQTDGSTEGWSSVTCFNFRNSEDTKTYVKGYSDGVTLKFKAGYKIFSSPQGANARPAVESFSQGSMTSWKEYTIQDFAVGLTASAVAASAILANVF